MTIPQREGKENVKEITSQWHSVVVEKNKDPLEGELIQDICMHILAFEKLVREYGIPRVSGSYSYMREVELPSSVYEALGWQGGTVHQVIKEIQSLKSLLKSAHEIIVEHIDPYDMTKENQLKYDNFLEAYAKAGV